MKQPRTELELDSYNVESLTYQQSLQMRYTNVSQLEGILNNLPDVPSEAYKNFSMQVTPYLAQLMDKDDVNCPIRLQYLPSVTEVDTSDFTLEDELGEGGDTVPGTSVVHRYPQRVLFLVSNTCGSLCRFCTRKRMVAHDTGSVSKTELQNSLDYICSNTDIEDVLLSGGDPFLFPDEKLDEILSYIRTNAPHVKFIRIGSRLSVQLPTRITEGLCAVIEKNDVQMINIHINHPKEITPVLIRRLKMLRKTGAMIGVQTVLLKGVNDDVNVLRQLFMKCIEIGVKPYYVYSTDPVVGAHHFIVSLEKMLELYEGLRGWISGPAMPTFVVDGLGGLGKLPIIPSYVKEVVTEGGVKTVLCRNYKNETVEMPFLA